MSNGWAGEEDPGGPGNRTFGLLQRQDMVDVVVNIDSFRFAQTGTLRSGGLVRWRVYRNGVPVKAFFVYPRKVSMPLVSVHNKIAGTGGVTQWIQVALTHGLGRVQSEFGIEIDGKRPAEWAGVLVLDSGEPKAAKRKKKPAPSAEAKRKT